MMLQVRFPVRPRPFNEESFPGFLTRVCSENGRTSCRQLFEILGLPYRPSAYNSRGGEFLALLEKLAPSIQLSLDFLKKAFLTENYFFSGSRSIEDVSVRHPKFCPLCLINNGFHRKEWEVITNTHCALHKIFLIDRCTTCGCLAQWDSFNFSCCAYCSTSWSSIKTVNSNLPPFYGLKPQDAAFDALIRAFHFTLRPCDLIFENIYTLSLDNEDIYFHLMQAHYLLASYKFRVEWFSSYSDLVFEVNLHHLLCEMKSVIDNVSLTYIKVKTSYQAIEPKFKIKHPVQGVCRKLRLKLAISESDLNAQLKISESARFLGVDLKSLHYLFRKGFIRPLNPYHPHRMQLYDVRNLQKLSDRLIEKCVTESFYRNSDDLISLSNFERKLTYFNIHKGQFIELLIESDLILIWPKSGLVWGDIKVDIYSLIGFLESIFINSLPPILSAKEFGEITSIKNRDWFDQKPSFPKSHVIDFYNEFLNVKRIARLHSVCSYKLKIMLCKNKVLVAKATPSAISPVVEKTAYNWRIIKQCISALKAVS